MPLRLWELPKLPRNSCLLRSVLHTFNGYNFGTARRHTLVKQHSRARACVAVIGPPFGQRPGCLHPVIPCGCHTGQSARKHAIKVRIRPSTQQTREEGTTQTRRTLTRRGRVPSATDSQPIRQHERFIPCLCKCRAGVYFHVLAYFQVLATPATLLAVGVALPGEEFHQAQKHTQPAQEGSLSGTSFLKLVSLGPGVFMRQSEPDYGQGQLAYSQQNHSAAAPSISPAHSREHQTLVCHICVSRCLPPLSILRTDLEYATPTESLASHCIPTHLQVSFCMPHLCRLVHPSTLRLAFADMLLLCMARQNVTARRGTSWCTHLCPLHTPQRLCPTRRLRIQ